MWLYQVCSLDQWITARVRVHEVCRSYFPWWSYQEVRSPDQWITDCMIHTESFPCTVFVAWVRARHHLPSTQNRLNPGAFRVLYPRKVALARASAKYHTWETLCVNHTISDSLIWGANLISAHWQAQTPKNTSKWPVLGIPPLLDRPMRLYHVYSSDQWITVRVIHHASI
jgi:hypothetical protein